MAAIPPELIFVLVFIAFSVLDAIGRKKKAEQKKAERKGAPGTVSGPRRQPTQHRETAATPPTDPAGSEELIPGDVWEEILGLARGSSAEPDSEAQPVEEAVEEPEEETSWTAYRTEDRTPEKTPDFQAPELESLAPRPEGVRSVPDRSRASSVPARPTGREGAWGKSAEGTQSDVRRDLFGDGTPEELRKAIILKEVLGPPVSMRE